MRLAEEELAEAIDALGRATTIIEWDMQASGAAALAQVDKHMFAGIILALHIVMDAASSTANARSALVPFVQQDMKDKGEYHSFLTLETQRLHLRMKHCGRSAGHERPGRITSF